MQAALWVVLIFRMLWLLTILVGTSYVVFVLGYSGWWWVLALILLAGGSSEATITTKSTST